MIANSTKLQLHTSIFSFIQLVFAPRVEHSVEVPNIIYIKLYTFKVHAWKFCFASVILNGYFDFKEAYNQTLKPKQNENFPN